MFTFISLKELLWFGFRNLVVGRYEMRVSVWLHDLHGFGAQFFCKSLDKYGQVT